MAVAWTAARACTVSIDQNCDETRIRLPQHPHQLWNHAMNCRLQFWFADGVRKLQTPSADAASSRVCSCSAVLVSRSASGWSDRCFQVRLWSGVSFSPSVDHKLGHSERWRLICRLSPTPSLKGQSAQNNSSRLEPQVQPDQLGLTSSRHPRPTALLTYK